MSQDERSKGSPLNVNENRVEGDDAFAAAGIRKTHVCGGKKNIYIIVFSETGSARSQTAYSDEFLENQS